MFLTGLAKFFWHVLSLFKRLSFWFFTLLFIGLLTADYLGYNYLEDFLFWPLVSLSGLVLFSQVFAPTAWYQALFGGFSWQMPSWLRTWQQTKVKDYPSAVGRGFKQLMHTLRTRPLMSLSTVGAIALVVGGSWWYINRPEPVAPPTASVRLSAPPLTRNTLENGAVKKIVGDIYMNFGASVAPLKLIGKPVLEGVRLKPRIKGQWKWTSANTLVFTPQEDWKLGQKYEVTLDDDATVGTYELDQTEFSFTVNALALTHAKGEFYEDPRDPKVRKAVYTLNFNYPIDKESLKDKIKLIENVYQNNSSTESRPLKHTLTFDKLGYSAFIHSEVITIPENEGRVVLRLGDGVKSLFGGPTLKETTAVEVRIPGIYNYFNVSSAQMNIIDNKKGIPEHVGVISFSTGVSPRELKGKLKVYELPYSEKDEQGRDRVIHWRQVPERLNRLELEKFTPVAFEQLPGAVTYPKDHHFKIKAKPRHYYAFIIEEGLTSAAGFKSNTRRAEIVYASEFKRRLKMLHEGSILSLRGDKKIHLYSMNVNKIKVRVGQLLGHQVQHLLTQSNFTSEGPEYRSSLFNVKNLAHFEERTLNVLGASAIKPSYQTFDFGRYLGRKLEGQKTRGVFFMEMKSASGYVSDKRLVIITDLGVTMKKDVLGNHDFFVQSLSTGKPVANARVSIIGENGLSMAKGTTDSRGHLVIPKVVTGNYNDPKPKGILVRLGQDMSYMRYDDYNLKLSYSRFAVGGRSDDAGKWALNAYLFSDRGIYRPGEEVRIAHIVQSSKWRRSFKGIPVDLEVVNSRGKTIVKKDRALSERGFDDLTFTLDRNAPTGSYVVNMYNFTDNIRIKYRRQLMGSVRIKVEEFLPDRLKIKADLSKKKMIGWVSPQEIEGTVSLKNLFGLPAAGHRMQATMVVEPVYLSFPSLSDFRFDNPTKNLASYRERLADQVTDYKGDVRYLLDLDKFNKKVFRLRFLAKGYEKEGGRSVSASASTMVSPYSYLIGLKALGSFSYIKKGAEKQVSYIAVNSDLKKVAVKGLKYRLVEHEYVNTLVKKPNGTFGYESVLKDKLLYKKDFALKAKENIFTIDTSKGGDFSLIVSNDEDEDISTFRYSVVGERNVARTLGRFAELQIRLDKKDYAQGDTIEMELKSAYRGAGLITIERDGVYAFKWFKQNKETTTQKIRLPLNVEGNAYVNVMLLRDQKSKEIYMSSLSYGVAPFTISKDSRREEITLEVPNVVKPGDEFVVNYQTKKPAQIILYAVNEGILQVAKYKSPKPLDFFFVKRSLAVRTFQILDLVLPEYSVVKEMLAAGGGIGEQAELMAFKKKGMSLNPFARKLEKPVAYWSGVLNAGPTKKKWKVMVPGHFNGELRVMAVAVGNGRMGNAVRRMFSRADLIISPNVLTFAGPGDEFNMGVQVYNNIEEAGEKTPIDLTLKASKHLAVQGDKTKKLQIDKNADHIHQFVLKAQDHLGSANVSFTAKSGKYSNTISNSVSLRPTSPYLVDLHVGSVKKDKVKHSFTRELYNKFATREVHVGLSPFIYSHSLKEFLGHNTYDCSEQIISRAFSFLMLEKGEKRQEYITNTLARIRARQNDSGDVLLYPEFYDTRPFLTLYTLHFLLEIKEAGLAYDETIYKKAISYIRNNLSSFSNFYLKSYSIYLLTRSGLVTTPFLNSLAEEVKSSFERLQTNKRLDMWGQDLAVAYMASSYALMQADKKASELISVVKLDRDSRDIHYPYYSSIIKRARLIDLFARHFPDRARALKPEVLQELFESMAKSMNTLNASYLLMALSSYERYAVKSIKVPFNVWAFDDKKKKTKVRKAGKDNYVFGPEARAIEIDNPNDNYLFYALSYAGFTKGKVQEESKGIEVIKEILNEEGKIVTSVRQGDEVTVRIRFRSTKDRSYNDTALVDLYPTGFAAVITEEGKGKGGDGYSPHFVDRREDRVVSYGAIGKDQQSFSYKMKATHVGRFTLPSVVISDMYHREHKGVSEQQVIVVEKP